MSISAIVMSFFSGVGVGKWPDQVVSSQRLGRLEGLGPAQ